MTMEFTADKVEKAVIQFYQNTGHQQAAEINQYLISAQISKEAWSFCWELLQPNQAVEVQFFGANALHTKIARFWHEVPSDEIETLRTQILQLVISYASGPQIVLTRLCVALASFLLQTMPERWPGAVNSIVNMFNQNNDQKDQNEMVLFKILRVLPEEYITSHLLPERRGLVRNELLKDVKIVADLLFHNLTNSRVALQSEEILRCFSSWSQLGFPLPESEPLILLTFEALRVDSLFDVAVEALIHVFSHPDNHKFPLSMQRLLVRVVQLNEMLTRAIEERDMDVCQGLCKLAVIAADQNAKLIVSLTLGDDQQKQIAFGLVNMILRCSGMPGFYPVDECCSDFPFGFWYNFQDEILGSSNEQRHVLLQVFCPVYMSLVTILLNKVQYPPDAEYQNWNPEERESHRCYRQDIADSLMYSYSLLHQPLVGFLCQLLRDVLERARVQNVPWQEIETLLFALTSIAEGIQLDDCEPMVSAFHLLPSIPCTNCTLVSQAMYFIGAFSEWMGEHPEMLLTAIPMLLQGLSNPELAIAATLALKEVVQENQIYVLPIASQTLLEMKAALESNLLKASEVVRLMSCMGYIVSTLPFDKILEFVFTTLFPYVEELKNLASSGDFSVHTRSTITVRIQMLAALFSSLNTNFDSERERPSEDGQKNSTAERKPEPTVYIIQQILPVIHMVLKNYSSEPQIIGETCEMFKRAITSLHDDFLVLLNDVSSLLILTFDATSHPSILDVSKQLLVLFVNNAEQRPLLQKMFTTLCNRTLITVSSGLQNHTDLLEALMHFLGQITKKNSNVLKDESCDLVGLFQAGVAGVQMHEAPTSKAACQFLSNFLLFLHQVPALNDVVVKNGQHLVDVLLRAVGGESPRNNIDPMADVFLMLNKFYGHLLSQWMNEAVNRNGFPNARVTREQKELFTKKLITERSNKRKVKELLLEFTLLWRGLINTEYGIQTSHKIT